MTYKELFTKWAKYRYYYQNTYLMGINAINLSEQANYTGHSLNPGIWPPKTVRGFVKLPSSWYFYNFGD
ncbi:hypothetical protein C7475_10197 [Chitinophaga sp. S165]|nr:hypothetical protein C7475_10197 [Chitinophaga sp. S165]